MKTDLNVVERMLLVQLFAGVNSPMGFAKVSAKQKFLGTIMITEEEKKSIDYTEPTGAVKQANFNRIKAEKIIKEYHIVGWPLDLIQSWLEYSEVLDDMKESHYSLYSKFCLNEKKE